MNIGYIEWLLYYWRCLFSVLGLDVRCDWQITAPKILCSLFPIHHLCVLRCITWKLQVVYGHWAYRMTALQSEMFFVWLIVAWGIKLVSYDPRYASVVLWYNTVCMCVLHAHTCITIGCTTAHDNKAHVPFDCIVHTKRWLECKQRVVFVGAKFDSYTTDCRVFSMNCAC